MTGLQVVVVATPELGDRSYVVHDGTVALVIDPQRDVERVHGVLDAQGLRIGAVAETHVHNDYVTGGYTLARESGVPYLVNRADPVSFDRHGVADGDLLRFGELTVEVVATPGHTDTHLAYVVRAHDAEAAVFTGGSLLMGTVGRTDLVDPARMVELARRQWESARRLADLLHAASRVYPTHGFGSFCASGPAGDSTREWTTLGAERAVNAALVDPDRERWVAEVVAGFGEFPSYYAHMAPLNRRGPGPLPDAPVVELTAAGVERALQDGRWVVDLRHRAAFASDHAAGTVSVELGPQFGTHVGWLAPWSEPVTLLADDPEQLERARVQLGRVGMTVAAGGPAAVTAPLPRGSYRRATFADAADEPELPVFVDVRRDDEVRELRLVDAVHVPLHRLEAELDRLPAGTAWVHCRSGYRAGIAASLLARAGRSVVHVDDDLERAAAAGLKVETTLVG